MKPWVRLLYVAVMAIGLVAVFLVRDAPPAAAHGEASAVLRVHHSGQCMDVAGISSSDGALIQQWHCHGGLNQQVQATHLGDGYHEIRFKHSNKCLDVHLGTSGDIQLQQWACHGGGNQRFTLPDLNWYGEVRNKVSQKCANVLNGSGTPGAAAIQLSCNGQANQRWDLFDHALYGFRLNGGPFGKYYTVNPYVEPAWYGPQMREAVSSWNAWGVVSFTETVNWSLSVIDYYSNSYGLNGLNGFTVHFLNSGSPVNPCNTCGPTNN